MAYQGIIGVKLERDGPQTAWGFRLQGGRDLGFPLTIQRVFLGSPSEGELHRGDIILKINNRDALKMSHQEATDLIKKAGNNLQILVQRVSGYSSPAATPTTPNHLMSTGHPLAGLAPGSPVTYQQTAPTYQSAAPPVSSQPSPFAVQPLPTTQFTDNYYPSTVYERSGSTIVPEPLLENKIEQLKEQAAIVTQTYRTTPLIGPAAKPRHDVPIGSYLRYVREPTVTTRIVPADPNPGKIHDAYMMAKVQETVVGAATPTHSLSPGRTPTPESLGSGQKMMQHRQYNSPLGLYSAQNIAETYTAQTGSSLPVQSQLQPSRRSPQPAWGAPSVRAGTRMSNIADITLSPTYQMIHNEEWKDLKKSDLKEHNPVKNQVYSVQTDGDSNLLGSPKGVIQQSNSFKTIMSTVMTPKLL